MDGWNWLKHSDSVLPDGTSRRKYQPVADRFPAIAENLLSEEVSSAFKERLCIFRELHPVAILVEDSPGYWIRRHTDCAGKVISAQCYLAEDDAHEHQGVELEGKQIPYRFNHGYAFKVTSGSWHRVRRSETGRRSIQLTYYNTKTPKL